MKIPYYHIDAFASARAFVGIGWRVCAPDWLPDEVASENRLENNLSETAFVVAHENLSSFAGSLPSRGESMRHATTRHSFCHLLSIWDTTEPGHPFPVEKAGVLTVERNGAMLVLDFPARSPSHVPHPKHWCRAWGNAAGGSAGKSYMAIFARQKDM